MGHTHDHSHEHDYEHSQHVHEHEHSHEEGKAHSHEHSHAHGGGHSHGTGQSNSAAENLALLNYMLEHNRHHAEDLHELFHALEADGKKEAAALLAEALHFYEHGNEKLSDALQQLKGE